MTIGSNTNIPASNPLGDNATGTTNTNIGKVTTGGQNANVDQNEKAQGTKGVAQSEKGLVGETSTLQAAEFEATTTLTLDAEKPEISAPRNFKTQPQNAEVMKWFSSTYLTSLSVNFGEIAKLGKDIHKAEGAFTVQMLDKVWKQAVQTADLIMAKAKTEANMHLALAISAMVGLAVSVAGAALSMGGGMKVRGSKSRMDAFKAGDTPDAPKQPNQTSAGSIPVGSTAPTKPLPPKPVKITDFDVPDGQAPKVSYASKGRPENAAAPDAIGKNSPDKPKTDLDDIRDQKMAGKNMQTVGMATTAAANSVREIIDNIVQMIFKPILAQFDGDIEKSRAVKELASKALDSAIQAFNSGTDIVDGAMRAMEKLSEVIKANSIGSR